jgi:hypothetical protein
MGSRRTVEFLIPETLFVVKEYMLMIKIVSAGTYEPNRPDSAELSKNPSELGATLAKEGFKDERWVDIRTDHIVNVMKARIDLAKSKKCDGLDPDNGMYHQIM